MVATAPPVPAHLALVAPAPREVSFGRITGRITRGRWAVVVRVGGRMLAVRTVVGGSFDFRVSLPRGDATVRVTAYAGHGRRAGVAVEHVYGLPRTASRRPVAGVQDAVLRRSVRALTRAFPGTSAVFVKDLVTGRGAAWNARARFPAASTLKLAIAVEALRAYARKPEPGSRLEALLRRMLIESDNDAANELESLFGGGSRVDELLRSVDIRDTWMGGGYVRGTAASPPPIPLRIDSQPAFGCCKYTTAFDLAHLLTYVHLAAAGHGPLIRRDGPRFTPSAARHLLYLLARVSDRGKLGRFLAGGPYSLLHKGGWISSARHDAGLVYWPGGVFVAAVMTWGSGAGVASDILAGRVVSSTLRRLERLG